MAQGKGSRAKNKVRRKAERRKLSLERKMQYEAEGRAGKRKKPSSESLSFDAYKHTHRIHWCGNAGCSQCSDFQSIRA